MASKNPSKGIQLQQQRQPEAAAASASCLLPASAAQTHHDPAQQRVWWKSGLNYWAIIAMLPPPPLLICIAIKLRPPPLARDAARERPARGWPDGRGSSSARPAAPGKERVIDNRRLPAELADRLGRAAPLRRQVALARTQLDLHGARSCCCCCWLN